MSGILLDMHSHSSFSPDANDSLEKMYIRAAELGFSAYAVTEHCDCNFWYPAEHYFDDVSLASDPVMYGSGDYAKTSISEQTRLRECFEGKLDISVGIELGQPLQDIFHAEEIVKDPRIDFVIGSHHQNAGINDFYYLKYDEMCTDEIYRLLEEYFLQILDMCKWGKFDVLGHLTYPLRYICGDYGIGIDISRFDGIIEIIFKTLAENGKGIEINTSGLRQKYGRTFPEPYYVQLYRQLGGEIITAGSDAHCTADLGKGIPEGIEIIRNAGFKYICRFKNRKPEFIKIR